MLEPRENVRREPPWRRYLLAGIVIIAIVDWAYPWLLLAAAQGLPLARFLSLKPGQMGHFATQSIKVSLYASLVLLPLAAAILLGRAVRNRILRWMLSLVVGWSVCALTVWAASTILDGQEAPKKEHGLYRLGTDERGATYAFSPQGPTFHLPLHWSPADPAPRQAAHLVRDGSDGAQASCWFDIFNDHRYRGLSDRQILQRFHDPHTFRELADTASLKAFDKLTLDGLPAYRSSWASIGTYRGIQVPLRTRVVTVAYRKFAISSGCITSELDSKVLAHELDDIQLSFKGPESRPAAAPTDARSSRRRTPPPTP